MTLPPAEPSAPLHAPRRSHLVLAVILVFLIAVATSFHAYVASATKSPTFDEPVHMASSWLIVNKGDFRLNPEHPPVWKYLAGLPLIGTSLTVDLESESAKKSMRVIEHQWWWTAQIFSQRGDGPSPVELLQRSRAAMAILPGILCLIVARWAWAWSGPLAAVLSSLLLALDPTLLGHGALVTNDVASTVIFAVAAWLTCRLGERFRWTTAVGLVFICALGAGVKFTCILLAPMVGIPLLIRAIEARPWTFGPRQIVGKLPRVGIVAGLAVSAALLGLALLWPLYQFRVAPTPTGEHFDEGYARRVLAYYSIQRADRLAHPDSPMGDIDIKRLVPAFEPNLPTRIIYTFADRRLLPESYSLGLIYAKGRSVSRTGFMLGETREHGSIFYFPLAMLIKTPLVALALFVVAAIVAASSMRRWIANPSARWKLLCLIVPPAIYLTSAMLSNLNIGIRHVLPIYPFMYLAAGLALATLIRRYKPAKLVGIGAIALLAVETGSAYPNYISSFNLAVGGPRGGIDLLGDSNLDWGQDLKALAEWNYYYRRANPGKPFYLAYFGNVDPAAYDVQYINAMPGYLFSAERPLDINQLNGGVYAISASFLQGTFNPEMKGWFDVLRQQEPLDVINDTIYIYRLPERP